MYYTTVADLGGGTGGPAPPSAQKYRIFLYCFSTRMNLSTRLAPQAKICHEIVYNSLPKTSKASLSALNCMRFVGRVISNGCGLKFSHAIIHLGPPLQNVCIRPCIMSLCIFTLHLTCNSCLYMSYIVDYNMVQYTAIKKHIISIHSLLVHGPFPFIFSLP